MGAGPNVNAFFGIMTMVIAVPTGVKVFNWVFTMYRGKVRFTSAMLWFIGFVILFVVGGMTGVMMAIPGIDFQVHNSLFLVAHFHQVIIGGVVFGIFAAYSYWFPKFTGFKLEEKYGKAAFWCWLIGFLVAFMPLYLLGFMGASRRMNHYPAESGWQPLFIVAGMGALLILVGVCFQALQLIVSIKNRAKNRDETGDPWDGATLEWTTTSPPPFYNYAIIPQVHNRDPFWVMKRGGKKIFSGEYEKILMPSNTAAGFNIGVLSFIFGFAAVWHMFWLVLLSGVGILVALIFRLYERKTDYYVTVEEVKAIEMRK
jgi:cytochrome o ubiquinol oxidase subunit 1